MSGSIDRPFVTDDLSSRASAPVRGVEYETSWSESLGDGLVDFILTAPDRVVVEGNRRSSRWLLFDAGSGKKIAEVGAGASDLLVDRGRGVVYGSDRGAGLGGWALNDGAVRWTYLVEDQLAQWRGYLARRGGRLVIASQDLPKNHALPTDGAKVEVHDLAENDTVDGRYLRSGTFVGRRNYRSSHVIAALGPEHLAVAVRDRIEVLDLDLKLLHGLDGKFLPEQLSVDDTGTIHAIVNAEGKRELWRVSDAAKVSSRASLPDGVILAPPLLDPDRRSIIVFSSTILAFDAAGALAWGHALPEIAGAIMTGDGLVLVATAESLVTLDARAEVHLVAKLREKLVTPPALSADGRIYVASATRLYALAPKKP